MNLQNLKKTEKLKSLKTNPSRFPLVVCIVQFLHFVFFSQLPENLPLQALIATPDIQPTVRAMTFCHFGHFKRSFLTYFLNAISLTHLFIAGHFYYIGPLR